MSNDKPFPSRDTNIPLPEGYGPGRPPNPPKPPVRTPEHTRGYKPPDPPPMPNPTNK
jgi:hypothetical protein